MSASTINPSWVSLRENSDLERTSEIFLKKEAEYLDDRRFQEWYQLLDPAISYEVPVRVTRENWDGSGVSKRAFFMKEDHQSLRTRIDRLASRYSWAENPATRTRRIIGNVRVAAHSIASEPIHVRSNLVVFCYRGEAANPQIVTADRQDELHLVDGQLRLLKRVAILDSSVLGLDSLSIFL